MKVEICGRAAVPKMIDEFAPDGVVSAVLMEPLAVEHLCLPIDDIFYRDIRPLKNAIRAVLMVADCDRLLIHCEHGKSRSAALAIAVLYRDDPTAVDRFLDGHPEAEPNPLLLLFADEILGADGDLLRRCGGRYKGHNL